MIHLNEEWLAQRGLGALAPREKAELLSHIVSTLEMQVGSRIAAGLTFEQLQEFEDLLGQGEAPAFQWLESAVPNYAQIVAEVLEELGEEVRSRAPEILARLAG